LTIRGFLLAILVAIALDYGNLRAEDQVSLKYSRSDLEAKWHARLISFLDKGVIPLIDLESSISRKQAEDDLIEPKTLAKMDELGVALIAFDANQAPSGKGEPSQGYRWGYHMHEVVNAHPDRFILTGNSGISKNWRTQQSGMIEQTESQMRSGNYAIMGEFEFRHYVSQGECKEGRFDREVNIPLDAPNGHRLFALSSETGIPFLIHNEPEDAALDALEKMLGAYPKAKVIQAHFGQIRDPGRQKRFTPDYVQHLLRTYPNLFFDISVGEPGRVYNCQGQRLLDTVIWTKTTFSQSDTLDPAYKSIFVDFSDRFVAGMDYGGGRPRLARFWEERVKNLRLILRDLPDEAKHNIAYRNSWKLLTGHEFAR
jgi:predicted TIM-barrel fold metal-dependent hydrolase